MKKLSKRSLAIFASVVALLLLLIVPVVTYLFVLQDSMLDVQHLTVTNVTSNSVTLTWVSDQPVYAYGAAVEGKFTEDKFSENGDYTFSRGYDDRDIIKAELEDNYDEAQLQLKRNQLGKYKTHHVTFRGLSPEKEYTFLLSDGITFVNLDEPVVATTLQYPDSLDNPKPAYGKITVEGEKTSISLPVTDGMFYYHLEDAVGQRVSNLISTPLAENGSWYLDLNSLLALDGTKVTEKYTNDELFLMLPVGEVRSADGSLYRKVIPMDANSPAEDFRLIPERLVTEIVEEEESELMSTLDNFVFTSSAGWSVDCNGKSYCASADVEALFNHVHGGNGQGQWESEACASGAPSTCAGAGTPGPQHQVTQETCSITYTENGAYGGNPSCTSDCINYGKKDVNGNCIPEWGPGSICKPQASCGNTCSGTQCVHGQYCNGGGNAQCCTGSCVNVGQENPAPTPPAGSSGSGTPSTGSGTGTSGKYWYCRSSDGSQSSCLKDKCQYQYYKVSEHSTQEDCDNAKSETSWWYCRNDAAKAYSCEKGQCSYSGGSYIKKSEHVSQKECEEEANRTGENTSTYKACLKHDPSHINQCISSFYTCPSGTSESTEEFDSITECTKWLSIAISNPAPVTPCTNCHTIPAPVAPCTNCHNTPGTPAPVTPCTNCHSTSGTGSQSSGNPPSSTQATCDSGLEARHSGQYCTEQKCGDETNCTAEQCIETGVPDLSSGVPAKRYIKMYRCPVYANIANHLTPPASHLNLYHTENDCNNSCKDTTAENGITWKGSCVGTAIDASIAYLPNNDDPRCSQVGYECKPIRGTDGNTRFHLVANNTYRCNYTSRNTSSSNFNFVNKVVAQSSEDTIESVLFDPETGLYYFPKEGEYEFFYGEDTFNVEQTAGEGSILFIDKNSNGEFDDGDERILESPFKLSFQKIIDRSNYYLQAGYNLVSFDLLLSTNKYRASDFLEYVNELDDIVYSISTYQSGKWMTMGMRAGESFGADDFLIVPGKAYLVKLSTPAELKLQGYRVDKPVALQLNAGWNLIPIHGSSTDYTAKSWLESLNRSGVFTADNVTKWDSLKGKYEGFQSDKSEEGELLEYGFDYPIDPKSGYFVKVKTGEGVWTPE